MVSAGVAILAGETKTATVTCPPGTRVLSGGFESGSANGNGASAISSSPTFVGDPNLTWETQGLRGFRGPIVDRRGGRG